VEHFFSLNGKTHGEWPSFKLTSGAVYEKLTTSRQLWKGSNPSWERTLRKVGDHRRKFQRIKIKMTSFLAVSSYSLASEGCIDFSKTFLWTVLPRETDSWCGRSCNTWFTVEPNSIIQFSHCQMSTCVFIFFIYLFFYFCDPILRSVQDLRDVTCVLHSTPRASVRSMAKNCYERLEMCPLHEGSHIKFCKAFMEVMNPLKLLYISAAFIRRHVIFEYLNTSSVLTALTIWVSVFISSIYIIKVVIFLVC